MQEISNFHMNNQITTSLCVTCTNCLSEKTLMLCDYGHFDKTNKVKVKTFTPLDFDCIEYEKRD